MNKAVIALCLFGCAAPDFRPKPKITPVSSLCKDDRLGPNDFCLPSQRMEKLLAEKPLQVLLVKPPSSGTSGSKTMYIEFPEDQLVIKAKWKASKFGGEGLNNEPRKEIAAYELQKLFLEPDEYVVPPTVGRCIPTQFYSAEVAEAETKPNFKGTHCVFGVLSYWLEHVTELGKFSKQRFTHDAAYRDRVATLNLFAYLFDHRDTRKSNFVVAQSADPRMFSIDNGLALSGVRNPRGFFVKDWSQIVVPALPQRLVERLRKLSRADLEKLATVAEYRGPELDPAEAEAPIDPNRGVRMKDGVLQLGLTKSEIDGIEERLHHLLDKVDAHKIALYDDSDVTARRRAAR